MNTPTLSAVLNDAADYIEKYGWADPGKGWFPTHGEPACMEGAVKCVLNKLGASQMYPAAKATLQRHVASDPRWGSVTTRYAWVWNDTVAEDATEVVAALRAAALIESTKEPIAQQVTA